MCGRYAIAQGAGSALPGLFDDPGVLEPNYNVAPGSQIPLVVAADGAGPRRLETAHWGLVPAWKKDFNQRPRPINARLESVATNGMFRNAFRQRRCILPASGYYEWQETAGGKQPWFIHPGNGAALAFAGLYELWPDPGLPGDDPGRWRMTTVIITRRGVDAAGDIHDRMPACLDPGSYAEWLGEGEMDGSGTAGDAGGETGRESLLASLAASSATVAATLQAHPVSRRVGNVRNRGADLVEPVALP